MALNVAQRHAVKYWPYAMNALDDGRLELGNNLAERAIKLSVIGRKNFLFNDTPRDVKSLADIYSVVPTDKANVMNPRKYVEWLLAEMANAVDPDDPAYLDPLMPWSDSVAEGISLKPAAAPEAAEMANEPIIDIDRQPSLRKRNRKLPRVFSKRNWKTLRGFPANCSLLFSLKLKHRLISD